MMTLSSKLYTTKEWIEKISGVVIDKDNLTQKEFADLIDDNLVVRTKTVDHWDYSTDEIEHVIEVSRDIDIDYAMVQFVDDITGNLELRICEV